MLYNVFMLVLGLVSRNALGNRGAWINNTLDNWL